MKKYQRKTNAIDVGLQSWEKKSNLNFNYRPEFRQFNRKNNDAVLAAYDIYMSGKSLQYIAEVLYQGRFTRQSLYDQFKVRGYKLRSKKLKPAIVYKGISYREDGQGWYRSRLGGKTVYLHRLIWEEKHGPIPADHYIILVDGNKANINIDNLKCLSAERAKKQYNHSNQFGYKRFKEAGRFGGVAL